MSVCLCVSPQDVKLSAEVEPFIPQKKGLEGTLISMSLSGETGGQGGGGAGGGGGGGGGGGEPAPIPSYLITCYPFVQENQPNRYRYRHNYRHNYSTLLPRSAHTTEVYSHRGTQSDSDTTSLSPRQENFYHSIAFPLQLP